MFIRSSEESLKCRNISFLVKTVCAPLPVRWLAPTLRVLGPDEKPMKAPREIRNLWIEDIDRRTEVFPDRHSKT
ncbi:hypothetical protein C7I87_06920 [Mesorhizobium sp. SARCC-RB16n]|nr:hypothetical protein C7I87_06920 [Mesorhizobium sp. SARCC-RB16n]